MEKVIIAVDNLTDQPWIKRMAKKMSAILFNAILLTFVIIAHLVYPTSLAGPGLDILVYSIGIVCSIVLIIKSLIKAINKNEAYWLPFKIYLLGFALLIILIFIPPLKHF